MSRAWRDGPLLEPDRRGQNEFDNVGGCSMAQVKDYVRLALKDYTNTSLSSSDEVQQMRTLTG